MSTFEISIQDKRITVELTTTQNPSTRAEAVIDGERTKFEFFTFDKHTHYLRIGHRLHRIDNVLLDGPNASEMEFSLDGRTVAAGVMDEQAQLLKRLGFKTESGSEGGELASPMPGKILELLVQVGEEVVKDQPLVILEAMKMENELKASADGMISDIFVERLQNVEKKQHILTIKPRG